MKNIRRIIAVMMMACIMIFLTGCTPDIVGSWLLTGGNAVQAIYTIDDSAQLVTSEAEAIFSFKEDGKLVISMTRDGINTELEGTWEADGEDVILTINGQNINCIYSVNDNTLNIFFTLEGQNANFVLNRK